MDRVVVTGAPDKIKAMKELLQDFGVTFLDVPETHEIVIRSKRKKSE